MCSLTKEVQAFSMWHYIMTLFEGAKYFETKLLRQPPFHKLLDRPRQHFIALVSWPDQEFKSGHLEVAKINVQKHLKKCIARRFFAVYNIS